MSSQAIPIPGPLSIGDIIDRAFRIYRARFKPMVLTALLLLVPLAILNGTVYFFLAEQSISANLSGDELGSLVGTVGSLPLSLLAWLIQGLAELALTFHALAALRDEGMEPRQAIVSAAGRFGSWLGMALVRGLAYLGLLAALLMPIISIALLGENSPVVAIGLACLSLIGMLAMFVLFVVLQTRWVVSTPSLVTERLGATQSLGRSWGLTRGKFWRSLGVMAVLWLIGLIVLSVPNMAIQMVAIFGTERSALWSAVGTAFGTILSALFVPLSAATYLVLYFDLRVRRENLDLDVRVQQLEAEAVAMEEAQP